jgi:hypothetical protein
MSRTYKQFAEINQKKQKKKKENKKNRRTIHILESKFLLKINN